MLLLLGIAALGCDTTVDSSWPHSMFIVSVGEELMTVSSSGTVVYRFGDQGIGPRWLSGGNGFVFTGLSGLASVNVDRPGASAYRTDAGNGLLGEQATVLDDRLIYEACPRCELVALQAVARYDLSSRSVSYLTDLQSSNWSPEVSRLDGSIYFLSDRDRSKSGAQVFVMNGDGSQVRPLAVERGALGGELALSRDGSLLAFTESGQQVIVYDVVRETALDTLVLPGEYYPSGSLSFSPSGDSLSVAAVDLVTDTNHLLVMDRHTKNIQYVMSSGLRIEADWFPGKSQ